MGAGTFAGLAACRLPGGPGTGEPRAADRKEDDDMAERGRLNARPGDHRVAMTATPGLQTLGLGGARDGLVYVPRVRQEGEPSALVVALHGAGGDARGGLAPLMAQADETGLLLLAPESRGRTWDGVLGGFGPDVEFVDRALTQVFERHAVDPDRVLVAGFSDGASYALSLGITNGDLFKAVIAFSPGFAAPGRSRGSPGLFISHGTADPVLPIDRTSRRLVPRLRGEGHEVRFEEFEGGHVVPAEISRAAVSWALG